MSNFARDDFLTYFLEVKEPVEKIFEKIAKRDRAQSEAIQKVILRILENPHAFKPLHTPLQGQRRVHVIKSFVLVYSIDEPHKTVILERYKHHDEIYSC